MTRDEADDYMVCGKTVALPADSILSEASSFELFGGSPLLTIFAIHSYWL